MVVWEALVIIGNVTDNVTKTIINQWGVVN
jgi:hypothetical protein